MVHCEETPLRGKGKQHKFNILPPGFESPSEAYNGVFKAIENLSSRSFSTFVNPVDDPLHQPWKHQTKVRAQRLAHRAHQLSLQQRNEPGWRMHIEPDVMERFREEIVCRLCQARLWRSDVESSFTKEDPRRISLERRQTQRQMCTCSPMTRKVLDYCEDGNTKLFDDRVEEFVRHDGICERRPDRVYGLRVTRILNHYLSKILDTGQTVEESIQTTPFKPASDRLIFPFLLLEAKSDGAKDRFEDGMVQSAHPIQTLLQLQEDLKSNVPGESRFAPFVWYLASKGDEWRLYATYTTLNQRGETEYNFQLLWARSITMLDGALQLILIMDFIIDWARDVYRQDILLHLAAIAKDKPCDQVTIDGDSDIFSSRLPPNIERWIPAPPSTIDAFLTDVNHSTVAPREQVPDDRDMAELAHESWRDHSMGAMRLVKTINYVFSCCYLTEQSVPVFIEAKTKRHRNKQKASEQAARQIIKFILQFNEVLLLKSEDLGKLEKAWTSFDRAGPSHPMTERSDRDDEFYVMLEVSNYFNCEWDLVSEISCLAISRHGFEALASYANFARSVNKQFQNLSKRYCSWAVLRRCISCLQSGSPRQTMLSAISSILMTLYPLPQHDGNWGPAATNLAFAYIRMPRLKPFLSKLFVATTWEILKTLGERERVDQRYTIRKGEIPSLQQRPDPRDDPSKLPCFERWSSKEESLSNLDNLHSHNNCARCRQVEEAANSPQIHGLVDQRRAEETLPSMILVCSSPAPEGELPMSFSPGHDLQVACVFVFDPSELFSGEVHLASLLTDLVQAGSVYHTIRHPLYPCFEESYRGKDSRHLDSYVSWNLPLPYRPITKEEHHDLTTWIAEVGGRSQRIPLRPETRAIKIQPILHCLRAGLNYDQTTSLLLDPDPYHHIDKIIDEQYKALLISNTYNPSIKKKKLKLAGDEVITIFKSWDHGSQHLARLRASLRETAGLRESSRGAEQNEMPARVVDTVMIDLT